MAEKGPEIGAPHAASDLADIRERIRGAISLPPLPRRSQVLLQALSDPGLDLLTLAELIEQTPALAARILGVANSAFFAVAEPVRSIPDAIIRVLGLNLVRDLGMSFALSQPFDLGACPEFDPMRYWRGSMELAVAAQVLAERLPSADWPSPSEAYLAGLLRHLGLLALVHVAPDAMRATLIEAERHPDIELLMVERSRLGLDHTEVGRSLADAWHLPPHFGVALGPLAIGARCGEFDALIRLILLASQMRHHPRGQAVGDASLEVAGLCRQLGIEMRSWPVVIELLHRRGVEIDCLAAAFASAVR